MSVEKYEKDEQLKKFDLWILAEKVKFDYAAAINSIIEAGRQSENAAVAEEKM